MFKQTPVLRRLEATRRQARFFEDRPESVSGAGVILTPRGGHRARSGSADYQIEARAQEILKLRVRVHFRLGLTCGEHGARGGHKPCTYGAGRDAGVIRQRRVANLSSFIPAFSPAYKLP